MNRILLLFFVISPLFLNAQDWATVSAIFAANCNGCHGGTAGVTLTTEAEALASFGTDCGSAIVPGDCANSPLISKIDSSIPTCDGGGAMPPGPSMSAAEIDAICQWIDALITLPFEWASFELSQNNTQVVFDWSTASETNTEYFILERSFDGNKFDEVENINAAGYSQTTQFYSTSDYPNVFNQTIYYRVKQIDWDGSIQYSEIKSILLKSDFNDIVTVYPNPINKGSVLNVEIESLSLAGASTIELFNVTGQLVLQQNVDISQGFNKFELELADHVEGLYFLLIKDSNATQQSSKIWIK